MGRTLRESLMLENKRIWIVVLLVMFAVSALCYSAAYVFPLMRLRNAEKIKLERHDGETVTIELTDKRIKVSYTFDLNKTVLHGNLIYADGQTEEIRYNPMSGTFWFAEGTGRGAYVVPKGTILDW